MGRKVYINTFAITPDVAEYVREAIDGDAITKVLIMNSKPVAAKWANRKCPMGMDATPTVIVSEEAKVFDPKQRELLNVWIGKANVTDFFAPQERIEHLLLY